MSQYESNLRHEIDKYRGHVDDLPAGALYCLRRLQDEMRAAGFPYQTFPQMIDHAVARAAGANPGKTVRVLSLGSGLCELEIAVLSGSFHPCRICCVDINGDNLETATRNAHAAGVGDRFETLCADINTIVLSDTYDIILANHSLHHLVDLEHCFDQVHAAMHEGSCFLVNDMIGRNGHMFWNDTLDLCNRIWQALPRELKKNRQTLLDTPVRHQMDCSVANFEGIRAQDILPLMDDRFVFEDFCPFAAIFNRFTGRDFGHNLDVDNRLHRAFLDYIFEFDHYLCSRRLLKPTQMFAVVRRRDVVPASRRWLYFDTPSRLYTLEDGALYKGVDAPLPLAMDAPEPSFARLRALFQMTVIEFFLVARANTLGRRMIRRLRKLALGMKRARRRSAAKHMDSNE